MLYYSHMPNIIESALSPFVQDFIDKYQEYIALKPSTETVAKIHVDEIASKIAGFYSYLRNIVDYREEHLLRKGIIERTLKVAHVVTDEAPVIEGLGIVRFETDCLIIEA